MKKLLNKRFIISILIISISILNCFSVLASNKAITSLKLYRNRMILVAYKDDSPIATMSVSCNLRNTPLGERKTGEKYRWHKLNGDNNYGQYCIRYGDKKEKGESLLLHSVLYSEMYNPYSLKQFTNKAGYSYNTYNGIIDKIESGGCVRLRVQDIKWLYENISLFTPITIVDTKEKLERPKWERVPTELCFDPTDYDAINLYNNGFTIDQVKELNKG